jgi:hypothetical protein
MAVTAPTAKIAAWKSADLTKLNDAVSIRFPVTLA